VSCATGWTCADLGNPTPAGSETVTGGTWTVKGGGGDIWNVSDQFRFESKSTTGDGMVSAHVVSQTNTNAWAKAGVMLRATSDPGSPYYGIFLTPGNGIAVQYRTAQGLTTKSIKIGGTAPVYLGIARTGANFTAYTSTDGTTWAAVTGSNIAMNNLPATVLAGLAVTSHNTGALSAVSFDTVVFSPTVPAAAAAAPRAASGTSAPAATGSSPSPTTTATPSPTPSPAT
jgi:hypothetical protein